jgi:hypothetical protein
VLQAHVKRPGCAVAPMMRQKLERTTAVPETRMLHRRELIEPRRK